ncbi:MAG: class I SAM-dependent methyltransferase [Ignavibacteria bacterium]|nr:class I SAM-dependent methyltransferase [Ignavibacteria bacterium]
MNKTITFNQNNQNSGFIFYKKLSEKFDLFNKNNLAEAENRFIINRMEKNGFTGGKVLDIGCGSGLFLDYIKKHPDDYFGIDNHSNMLMVMKRKHPNVNLMKLQTEDIGKELKENKYDNIISLFEGFSCVNNLSETFEGIHRVLKPSGKFFIMIRIKGSNRRRCFIEVNDNKPEVNGFLYNELKRFRKTEVIGFNLFAEKLPLSFPKNLFTKLFKWESLTRKLIPGLYTYVVFTGSK